MVSCFLTLDVFYIRLYIIKGLLRDHPVIISILYICVKDYLFVLLLLITRMNKSFFISDLVGSDVYLVTRLVCPVS